VHEVVRQNGRGGWLPYDYVAHECGGRAQVACDGGEVEGRDGVDEAFEGAVLNAAVGSEGESMGGCLLIEDVLAYFHTPGALCTGC